MGNFVGTVTTVHQTIIAFTSKTFYPCPDCISRHVESIPRAVRKLEFGQRESSRGSIDRKEVSINAIRTSLHRPNPGALAQSKFQFANRSGYKLSSEKSLIS